MLARSAIANVKTVGNNFNYNKTVDKGGIRDRVKRADKMNELYDGVWSWVRDWPDREAHIKQQIGIEMPEKYFRDSELTWLTDSMKKTAYVSCTEVMKARLHMELQYAKDHNWFVYFTTLTIDNRFKNDVFCKGSNVWRNYYRSIERICQRAGYGSVRNAKGKKCFEYGCVVEEGEMTGQLHIHTLMFSKFALSRRDPNYGLAVPYKREIDELEWNWREYGYAQTIAVRFSNADAFGQLGWAWPVDKACQPIPATTVLKLSQYMVKYILKSKLNGKDIPWRTRCSRMMGKTELTNKIQTISGKQVEALVALNVYPKRMKLYGMKIPGKLIREIALTELVRRYKCRKERLTALKEDTRIRGLLKSGTLRNDGRKSRNSGSILAQIYGGRNTSNTEILDEWNKARIALELRFPGDIALGVSGGIITGR